MTVSRSIVGYCISSFIFHSFLFQKYCLLLRLNFKSFCNSEYYYKVTVYLGNSTKDISTSLAPCFSVFNLSSPFFNHCRNLNSNV